MNPMAPGTHEAMGRGPVRLKGRLPFALAVPSFVFPAGWAENVERLGPFVDEIEQLHFESGNSGAFPDAGEIQRLATLGRRHGLTYNVHLPIDIDPGSVARNDRERAVSALGRAIACTAPLAPATHTLHLPVPAGCREGRDLGKWHDRVIESLRRLGDISGIPSRAISVETLLDPFALVRPVIEACDLSVCIDTGHLLLAGEDPATVTRQYRERITIFHLHGVAGEADHQVIARLEPAVLETLLTIAATDRRTVSLELFSPGALFASMALLKKGWAIDSCQNQPPD